MEFWWKKFMQLNLDKKRSKTNWKLYMTFIFNDKYRFLLFFFFWGRSFTAEKIAFSFDTKN